MILCLGGKNSPLSPPSWNCKRGHQSHANQNFDHIQADFKYWAQVPWIVQTHPALECSLVLDACPSPTPRTPQALSCHLLQWPHTSMRLIIRFRFSHGRSKPASFLFKPSLQALSSSSPLSTRDFSSIQDTQLSTKLWTLL